MTTKQQIRAEIERLIRMNQTKRGFPAGTACAIRIEAYKRLLPFLDTLPDESEQPTKGYDEAYLNEKIAKASKSWEGVDVDKFMDEIRGREPVTDCNDLEEEIKEQIYDRFYDLNGIAVIGTSGYAEVKDMEYIARHFAEWQKRKMMEGAVEGFVGVHLHDKRADVTVNSGYLPKEMGIKGDSKVKIIIVKEDKK